MGESAVKASSSIIIPRPLKWYHRFFAAVIYRFIRGVGGTVRFRWVDRTGLLTTDKEQPVVFCIWHNRLALSLYVKRIYLRGIGRTCPLAAMVSASKDGGILARVLERFGAKPARGSTSRRGPQALRELTTLARRGYDLAITPDGPRGPCYVVQPGVISVAQVTGHPIIPVSYQLRWKICTKSWDRFQIPLPFTSCVVTLGEPVWVPRECAEEEREVLRKTLEKRLKAMVGD